MQKNFCLLEFYIYQHFVSAFAFKCNTLCLYLHHNLHKMKKDCNIVVRLDTKTKAKITQGAKEHGINISKLVRSLIEKSIINLA